VTPVPINGDRVEATYARSALFERSAGMMRDWADYCVRNVVAGAIVIDI